MNYEKAYDEALERARKFYDANTNEGYRKIFEEIFPQLKESEDEKIRKELVSLVLNAMGREKDSFSDDKYDSMLAWLEKHAEWTDEDEDELQRVINCVKGYGIVAEKLCQYDKEREHIDKSVIDYHVTWLKSLKERLQ